MKISRRSLLQSMLAAPPAAAALCRGAGAAGTGRPLLLICDGIGSGFDPQALRSFLDPLQSRKLRVGLILGDGTDGRPRPAEVCAPIEDELVEWIVNRPAMADEPLYFQMRQATAGQADFAASRSACGGAPRWDGSLTLACRQQPTTVPSLGGVRAAGFRTVLVRPDADAPVSYWTTDNGVLELHGGRRIGLAQLDGIIDALFETGDAKVPLLVYLALDELSGLSADAARATSESFGAVVAAGMRDGTIVPMLPSDFHLALGAAPRCVAVHVAGGGTGSGVAGALAAAGIPFSVSGVGEGRSGDACAFLRGESAEQDRQALQSVLARGLAEGEDRYAAPPACAVTTVERRDLGQAIAAAGVALVMPLAGRDVEAAGLDQDGLLHAPAPAPLGRGLDSGRARLRDAVILIRAEETGSAEIPALRDALTRLAQDKANRIVGLPGFAQGVMPNDRILALLKRAEAMDFVAPAESGAVDAAERAQLLQDAALAWRYFDRFTDRHTGLAASTAQLIDGAPVTYPIATMWDIGSQILATAAALSIGLIDQAAFSDRMARLLKSLPASRLAGLTLPQSNVSTTRKPVKDTDFRASDTGRLLVALKLLQSRFGFEAEVARIVGRWDLAKVIVDGRLQDLEGGRFRDYYATNYADYAVRGFRLFGLESQSPYALETDETGTDRQMRLLYKVADLGPVATEPHALEELELGHSEASRLIARLLFAAQASAWEATGRFFCVSEISLDRAPWFSYQGLDLGASGDPWSIKTVSGAARYQTERFRADTAMVSTKGAYAWAAVHPHDYARKLLAYVREHARVPDLGFASGIYAKTGLTTQGYSDSNTNGVILQSIAYILGGRKPALPAA